MKIAVSNIAWPTSMRSAAYQILAERRVTGLEIAPGLFFAGAVDPFVPEPDLAGVRLAELDEQGLELVSMQSLLFGVEGAALFEGPQALQNLETGMARAIDLAARFDIPNLVFGSPKQRIIPDGMSPQAARDFAAEVFARLGTRASAAGTVIAMEANPEAYGTNFLTHAEDVLAFVHHVDHPGLRMVMDIGAMHLNKAFDQTGALIASAAPVLSHVHISEPFLAPAPADSDSATEVLQALSAAGYDKWVSIEMKTAEPDPLAAMAGAIDRLMVATEPPQKTEHKAE